MALVENLRPPQSLDEFPADTRQILARYEGWIKYVADQETGRIHYLGSDRRQTILVPSPYSR